MPTDDLTRSWIVAEARDDGRVLAVVEDEPDPWAALMLAQATYGPGVGICPNTGGNMARLEVRARQLSLLRRTA